MQPGALRGETLLICCRPATKEGRLLPLYSTLRPLCDVGAQILPLEITQLIVRIKVLCGESRTALHPDHFHSRFAELAARSAWAAGVSQSWPSSEAIGVPGRSRDFGAWLGLVPKQISTGDRTRGLKLTPQNHCCSAQPMSESGQKHRIDVPDEFAACPLWLR